MRATLLVIVLALGTACPPAALLPSGCGKDSDCKGARICVAHACVEPPALAAEEAPPDGAVDGGAPLDGGAAEEASFAAAPPVGASSMFHGDPQHTRAQPLSRAVERAARDHACRHRRRGHLLASHRGQRHHRIRLPRQVDLRSRSRAGGSCGVGRRATWCGARQRSAPRCRLRRQRRRLASTRSTSRMARCAGSSPPAPAASTPASGPRARAATSTASPSAPDGTMYVSADGLYALDARRQVEVEVLAPASASTAPRLLRVGPDGTHLSRLPRRRPLRHRPRRQKRWDFRTGDDVDSSPAIGADGTVYVGSDDHKLYALGPGGALALGRHHRRRRSAARPRSPPTAPSTSAASTARSTRSSRAAWSRGASAPPIASSARPSSMPPATCSSAREDDRLYAVAPDGKLLWSAAPRRRRRRHARDRCRWNDLRRQRRPRTARPSADRVPSK